MLSRRSCWVDVSSRDRPTLTASVEEVCEIHKPNYHNQSRQQQQPSAQATKQAPAGALMAHHPAWVGHHTGGSRSKPTEYTRAHFGSEAVGCVG